MNGSWLVRILFIGALALICFGAVSLEGQDQTSGTVEETDESSPESAPFAGSDDAGDNRLEDVEEPTMDEDQESDLNGGLFIGFGGGIIALLFAGAGAFEVVKVALLMALFTPLLARKSRNDELNRGRILGYIEANTGIHFSALRDALRLVNGVTAHHLHTLELQHQIVSWRDGKFRRYASANLSVDQRSSVKSIVSGSRLAILEVLSDAGQLGLPNPEIAKRLELSRQLLSYHLKHLNQADLIEKTTPKRRSSWRLTATGIDSLVQGEKIQRV
ncbi:MAG: helix-turn-helix domain-containing protein [Candidatus Poseidonia sp.]|nr:helix-turn-helix domain-containing protein [Poseidonia sp.]